MFGFRRASPPTEPLVCELDQLDRTARGSVGLKAANLGELQRAGVCVPPGFVISAGAYRSLVAGRRFPTSVRSTDEREIQQQARELEQQIAKQPIPKPLDTAIRTAYQRHVERTHRPLVAVRGSISVPGDTDGRETTHSATVLNVQGADAMTSALRHVWSAAVAPAALIDWLQRGIDPSQVGVAVIVQQMVSADRSGVLYTADPTTGDRSTLTIEAIRGLGPALTAGLITPDRYTVDRESLTILERRLTEQPWQLARTETDPTGLAGTRHVAIAADQQAAPKLTDDEVLALARIGRQLADHFGTQLDIEWAIEDGQLWILEARPVPSVTRQVPVTSGKQQTANSKQLESESPTAPALPIADRRLPLAKGASASLGTATGIARIVHTPADFDRIRRGDVVVSELTTLNLAPILARAAALVTDTGGRTSHAAIAGHEHGLPVIVGTGSGSHTIKDGQLVTVDGTAGVVYAGKLESGIRNQESGGQAKDGPPNSLFVIRDSREHRARAIPLGTKLYAILSDPAQAESVAAQPVDGVGLLRAEFMIAGLGEHPAAMEAAGRGGEFTAKLAAELTKFAEAFSPRPVIYRTSDFKSNEYRSLTGGDAFEPYEPNPMLGYRGVARYLREPKLFRRELDAIKQVAAGLVLRLKREGLSRGVGRFRRMTRQQLGFSKVVEYFRGRLPAHHGGRKTLDAVVVAPQRHVGQAHQI